MTQLFLSLLNVSFKASYIVLAILFIRFAFKRIPKSILCIMWSLVGIRLIMPVSIKSMFSLIPETDVSTNINQSISINNTSQNISNNVNQMMSSTSVSNTGSIDIMSILSIIWIIGMICMIIYTIYSYYKLYKKVNVSIQYSENVYLCDDIDTPFILGIIKPKIYPIIFISNTNILCA
jgi:beta-lactamase regulating signal transducer with metallopeptidase domain